MFNLPFTSGQEGSTSSPSSSKDPVNESSNSGGNHHHYKNRNKEDSSLNGSSSISSGNTKSNSSSSRKMKEGKKTHDSKSSPSSSSSPSVASVVADPESAAPPHKTSKRNRRRRNMKSRKTQIEPVSAATEKQSKNHKQSKSRSKKHHDAPMTRNDLYFALDCEMVGTGPDGFDSAVARVTLVNWENQVVLDTFVKVPVPVTDYRSHISGVTAEDIESDDAMTFDQVRSAVCNILRGKILIGHGLENDLCALSLTHPYSDVRDTACYTPFMREVTDYETGKPVLQPRKLRDLAWEKMGMQIQVDGVPHSPLEDAIAALELYKLCRSDWEKELSIQQMEQIRAAENQRRARSFFWGQGGATVSAAAASVSDSTGYCSSSPSAASASAMEYAYNGPFGPSSPGYAHSAGSVSGSDAGSMSDAGSQMYGDREQPPSEDGSGSTKSSPSWRWYPSLRRAKSPPPAPIPEDRTAVPVSPRSSGFFRLRRQKSIRAQRLQSSSSNETDTTTVCTETDSNIEVASDVASETGSNFEPDYTFLEETKWSQSFQVIEQQGRAQEAGVQTQMQQTYDSRGHLHTQQVADMRYFDQQQRYYNQEAYGAADWSYGSEPARDRFVSI